MAIWSVMTAACGLAVCFATMFMARMGVGIGEAGACLPPTRLVADYFRPSAARARFGDRRAPGVSARSSVWRWAVWSATVSAGGRRFGCGGGRASSGPLSPCPRSANPAGEAPRRRDTGAPAVVPLRTVLSMLARRRSYIFLTSGITIAFLGGYAQQTWTPTFFVRSFRPYPGPDRPAVLAAYRGSRDRRRAFSAVIIVDRWTAKDRRAPVWILSSPLAAASRWA